MSSWREFSPVDPRLQARVSQGAALFVNSEREYVLLRIDALDGEQVVVLEEFSALDPDFLLRAFLFKEGLGLGRVLTTVRDQGSLAKLREAGAKFRTIAATVEVEYEIPVHSTSQLAEQKAPQESPGEDRGGGDGLDGGEQDSGGQVGVEAARQRPGRKGGRRTGSLPPGGGPGGDQGSNQKHGPEFRGL